MSAHDLTPRAAPLDVLHCPLAGLALIEASAGTGKTWAICALVLRLVAEAGFAIDQILVLTFTHAATAELRERVRQRIVEALVWLEATTPPDDAFFAALVRAMEDKGQTRAELRARLRAALAAFDEAAIFTIHGFCQRALGESPFAAGQPFALELVQSDALIREVTADYWRRCVAHGTLTPALAAWLAGRGLSPAQLEKLLRRALQKPLAQTLWPEALQQSLSPPDFALLEAAYAEAKACWQQEREVVRALLEARLPDLKYLKAEDLAQGVADWDACFASGQALAEISDKAENFRAAILRDKKTRKGKTPPEHAFFEAAEKLWQRRDTLEAELEQQRLALFRDFLAWATPEMQTRKRARRQVDYDDLLGNLHRALTGARGAALAASLRTRYPAALIDEFQDTDPLQFEIFQTLYANRDNPAFLVGDPKQAIYSFRQADLHTYLAARKEARARYWLQDNQRSCPGVIAGVNALFSANPQAFMLAGLDFLAASRGAKPLPVLFDSSDIERGAFHFWQLPAGEAALDKASALQRTAEATAAEIARLLAAARRREICVGDSPLPPKRIAILVRTHRQGWLIKEALAAVGVQAAELAQDDVFLSAEAEDLERLLLALLEPARLGALKAALATPLFGLNAHDIAALNEEEAALNAWLERFARWHRLWQKRGVLAALNRVGQERQFAARLLALPEGERRLTNHLHLVELLHRMEDQTPQAARLLREFSRKRQAGVEGLDETAQLRLESDRDLVSIVTIHRAKGLEYDIVFCPFLWEGGGQPSGQALPGQFYHDGDGRLRLDYRPEGEAAKQAARQEQAAEWLRLYYVALTRPVHRCYLVWGDYTLRGSRVESARSLLNWLVAGAGYQPEAWLTADGKTLPDAAALKTAWQTLIAGLDASTEALPETGLAGQTRRVAEEAAEDYAAAVAHRALTPGFRIDSFSSLIRHGDFSAREGEGKAQDDLPDLPSLPDAPERLAAQMAQRAQTPPDDILHFPRGPQAGDCIHDFLERLDFDRPESHAFAADLALSRHPPGDPERKADHPAMLKTLATNLAATPLPLPGCRTPFLLHTLTPARRLVELEFYLPVARLDAHVLQNIMTAHGEPVPRLDFPAAHGFLKGYIDLIFAHEGRYYVLDWKSNHLGWTPEDYSDAALREAMGAHGYTLQARLYLLALHRYLKCRLPDYTPAHHLGGACYLFLRGVRPDWQQPHGLPTGVCLLPPKGELVLEMERALG